MQRRGGSSTHCHPRVAGSADPGGGRPWTRPTHALSLFDGHWRSTERRDTLTPRAARPPPPLPLSSSHSWTPLSGRSSPTSSPTTGRPPWASYSRAASSSRSTRARRKAPTFVRVACVKRGERGGGERARAAAGRRGEASSSEERAGVGPRSGERGPALRPRARNSGALRSTPPPSLLPAPMHSPPPSRATAPPNSADKKQPPRP